jgi:head-tail adaptor
MVLRDLINVYRIIKVPDNLGGYNETLSLDGTYWAKVEELSDDMVKNDINADHLSKIQVTLRGDNNISTDLIIQYNGKYYRVVDQVTNFVTRGIYGNLLKTIIAYGIDYKYN